MQSQILDWVDVYSLYEEDKTTSTNLLLKTHKDSFRYWVWARWNSDITWDGVCHTGHCVLTFLFHQQPVGNAYSSNSANICAVNSLADCLQHFDQICWPVFTANLVLFSYYVPAKTRCAYICPKHCLCRHSSIIYIYILIQINLCCHSIIHNPDTDTN